MAGRGRLKNFYLLLGVVVVAGVAALVYKSQTRGSATAETGPMPVVAADSVPPAAYVIGSDTAPVVIDDYSDFQCPFCAQLAILTFPDVRTRLVNTGIVRWRFHDRPLNIHNKTLRAHLAAACAAEQNKFFQMHDQIYFHQGDWVESNHTDDLLRDYAKGLGLNMDAYDACVKSAKPMARIQAESRRADQMGINSTPTLLVNGRVYDSEKRGLGFDDLKAYVDSVAAVVHAEREKESSATATR